MPRLSTPNFGAIKDPALQGVLRTMHANMVALAEAPSTVVQQVVTQPVQTYIPAQDYQRGTVTAYSKADLSSDLSTGVGRVLRTRTLSTMATRWLRTRTTSTPRP